MKEVDGRVVRGRGRGQVLGFPTANLELADPLPNGIYAGSVWAEGKEYPAAFFIGRGQKILEAHLIGFHGDLYGRAIRAALGKKIRDVQSYDSDETLISAIKKDVGEALRIYRFP